MIQVIISTDTHNDDVTVNTLLLLLQPYRDMFNLSLDYSKCPPRVTLDMCENECIYFEDCLRRKYVYVNECPNFEKKK